LLTTDIQVGDDQRLGVQAAIDTSFEYLAEAGAIDVSWCEEGLAEICPGAEVVESMCVESHNEDAQVN
jgi:hypothetical protein